MSKILTDILYIMQKFGYGTNSKIHFYHGYSFCPVLNSSKWQITQKIIAKKMNNCVINCLQKLLLISFWRLALQINLKTHWNFGIIKNLKGSIMLAYDHFRHPKRATRRLKFQWTFKFNIWFEMNKVRKTGENGFSEIWVSTLSHSRVNIFRLRLPRVIN